MNLTAKSFWNQYLQTVENKYYRISPEVFHFCDNQKDADRCADLVLKGIKTATSYSMLGLEINQESLPEIGEKAIVTDWSGNAKAIIETTKIDQVPFNKVSEHFAFLEGEGDRSLENWKEAHLVFFEKEANELGYQFSEDMLLVCEQFKNLFTIDDLLYRT